MDLNKGSEWRKWDLHVHVPNTKLSNGYIEVRDQIPWDDFCNAIEQTDVSVFGITDYFSIDSYFEFIEKFGSKYPNSKKQFFPNVELRLNESVNGVQEEVNIHLIFRNDLTKEKLDEFMHNLKTEITDGQSRPLSCTELLSTAQYESAVVTRQNISKAFKETFGEKAVRQDYMLVVTAANNDGIRPQRGQRRKENISDEIDKISDAFFGGSQNKIYFLTTDRLEDNLQIIKPKPVFSGSDAHNFQQFHDWVGKSVSSESVTKEITWVKADPTFQGLIQTLIEPDERVTIRTTKPDEKEPYKFIKRVTFSGTTDFPTVSIELNPNLSSIIGSRSSGKSALLAYIAHTINAEDTIARQIDAQSGIRPDEIGPAAGISWRDVQNIVCEVEWASGAKTSGKVVYIPQNYLHSISNRPTEITNKIEPVLFNKFPEVKSQFEKTRTDIESCNQAIEVAVNHWFDLREGCDFLREKLRELGDKSAIMNTKEEYQRQINELKVQLSITEEDIKTYQEITQVIAKNKARLIETDQEKSSLLPFLKSVSETTIEAADISPTLTFYPSIESLPLTLSNTINDTILEFKGQLSTKIKQQIVDFYHSLQKEQKDLNTSITKIVEDNSALIERYRQYDQLTKLVTAVNKQNTTLAAIEEIENQIKSKTEAIDKLIETLNANISVRETTLKELAAVFVVLDQSKEKITFGIEYAYDLKEKVTLADKFNRQNSSTYLDVEQQTINIGKIRSEPGTFLEDIYKGVQKLKIEMAKKDVAKDILISTEEIRFTAVMESDKIGGFTRSAMTPGKRALFALTLMLSESNDAWPLLIDQPEDDLDSRSIYNLIVPYIIDRKKERQIIMVSHNANLVIGSDSEQIIVANKHGDDRKNRDNRMFEYLTGSLESSKSKTETEHILDSCGIREHACEILDGGEEAFEKRKNKYRL